MKYLHKKDFMYGKKTGFFLFVMLLAMAGLRAQDTLRTVDEIPFQRGEKGKYRV